MTVQSKEVQVVYVVSEVGFEYNDEIMYIPESGGGTPIKAFQSLERAMQEMYEKTLRCAKDLGDYGYEMSEVINCDILYDLLDETKLKESWEVLSGDDVAALHIGDLSDMMPELLPLLNDEQKERLYEAIYISFYEIKTLEISE